MPGSATLVLGGARSGKSRFAEGLAAESGLAPVYFATGSRSDTEMADRIALHQARRGPGWRTVEIDRDLCGALDAECREGRIVLVDCLTLWLGNLTIAQTDIGAEIEKLAHAVAALQTPAVFVANEVGLGIVPDNRMAREFRDHAGTLNQMIADVASEVYFIAAGLPLRLKPSETKVPTP